MIFWVKDNSDLLFDFVLVRTDYTAERPETRFHSKCFGKRRDFRGTMHAQPSSIIGEIEATLCMEHFQRNQSMTEGG